MIKWVPSEEQRVSIGVLLGMEGLHGLLGGPYRGIKVVRASYRVPIEEGRLEELSIGFL